MSVKGTERGAGSSTLERVLVQITHFVLRYPVSTLILAAVLACAALGYSQLRLGFRTSRSDLLNPQSEFTQRWLDYVKEFGDEQDVVIVVEGDRRDSVVAARDEAAAAARHQTKYFTSVLSGIDPAPLRAKGLYYLSMEELCQVAGFVEQMTPALRDQWSRWSLGALAEQWLESSPDEGFLASLDAGMQGHYQSPFPEMRFQSRGDDTEAAQLLRDGGRMAFVLLKLVPSEQDRVDFVRGARQIETLRDVIAQVRTRHSAVKIGLTGVPIIEYDEMASSQSSMSTVSVASFVAVWLLFVAGFGGWRHPLLAVTSLTVGTGWAMGYITGMIGHLNILSSAFAVILIGQGIDFSMYYVAQYLQLSRTSGTPRDALVKTVATVGPGVATGAVTTAVAFFMAGLTDFTGIAELGIIAGGGILLCWIAGLTVLPALIHLVDSRWPYRNAHRMLDVRVWIDPLMQHPGAVLVATSVITMAVAWGISRIGFDYNLLHLQAKGLESVELEQRLLCQCDQNSSFAISIAADADEVRRRKAQFERLASVKRVEEFASRLPEGIERKRPIVAEIHRQLANLPQRVPRIPISPKEVVFLERIASRAGAHSGTTPQARESLTELADALSSMTPQECLSRLSQFQQSLADDILGRLRLIAEVAEPEPPSWVDFPDSLVSRFVSPHGRYLMKVYSRGSIWDTDSMQRFATDVRSVDPRATGNPLQVYEACQQMQRSYIQAALYALAIILPVVFLDFRSIRLTALALLPLGLGMVQMFGLMGLAGVPLNPANMIVLPLILGIGIDAGVHVVHDYVAQTGPYRINGPTASAVVINTVTNIAGFGALMLASHQGLQSLGRVLTLGLSTCLFTSLVMLPALLTLLSRQQAAAFSSDIGHCRPADDLNDAETEGDVPATIMPVYRIDSPMRQAIDQRPALEEVEQRAQCFSRRTP